MKKFTLIAIVACILIGGGCRKKKVEPHDMPDESFTMSTIASPPVEEVTVASSPKLQIVANIYVKPEALKVIMPHFKAMVEASQNENGCNAYSLHRDSNDSTKFVIIEEWLSQDDFDYHNNTDHMKAYKAATKDMQLKSDVTILTKVY